MRDDKSSNHLSWSKTPRGTYIASELFQSDAWRSLTKTESDIWLFVLTRRRYPRSTKKRDYWNPTNKCELQVPTVAIEDFFDGEVRGMNGKPPNHDTVRKAFKKFMAVGLLSLIHQGGNGKGDQNVYKLEHDWRTWKIGDPPCYTKAGMARGKGFCKPGSGKFYRNDKN